MKSFLLLNLLIKSVWQSLEIWCFILLLFVLLIGSVWFCVWECFWGLVLWMSLSPSIFSFATRILHRWWVMWGIILTSSLWLVLCVRLTNLISILFQHYRLEKQISDNSFMLDLIFYLSFFKSDIRISDNIFIYPNIQIFIIFWKLLYELQNCPFRKSNFLINYGQVFGYPNTDIFLTPTT